MAGNIKFTKEIVNNRLRDKGISITGEYINSTTKTEFMCVEGHKWVASPNNVMHKAGCPKCNGGVSHTIEKINEIKSALNFRGITFDEFKNSVTKVEFTCKEGHTWKTTLQSVVCGTGCPYCSTRPPITKDMVNEKLICRDIKLIGDYKSCHTKTTFECSNGHIWSSIPDNVVRKGNGCPFCASDMEHPAHVYILAIEGQDDAFTGFGITIRKYGRIFTHSIVLAKTDKKIIRQKIFDTATKRVALQIENRLKSTLPIYNANISGFRTEATKLDFDTVIHIVDKYILEEAYNEQHM